jgi:hypothetical protein
MPEAPPSSSTKYQVIFQDTIFLLLHMLCVIVGALVVFVFSFLFILFAEINGWITPCFFGERHALFS